MSSQPIFLQHEDGGSGTEPDLQALNNSFVAAAKATHVASNASQRQLAVISLLVVDLYHRQQSQERPQLPRQTPTFTIIWTLPSGQLDPNLGNLEVPTLARVTVPLTMVAKMSTLVGGQLVGVIARTLVSSCPHGICDHTDEF
jgi:hypothetical protein